LVREEKTGGKRVAGNPPYSHKKGVLSKKRLEVLLHNNLMKLAPLSHSGTGRGVKLGKRKEKDQNKGRGNPLGNHRYKTRKEMFSRCWGGGTYFWGGGCGWREKVNGLNKNVRRREGEVCFGSTVKLSEKKPNRKRVVSKTRKEEVRLVHCFQATATDSTSQFRRGGM